MDNQYYASADLKTASKKIMSIINSQSNRMFATDGISSIWKRNLDIYYKNALCDVINFTGSQGELVSMSVPQARSLVRQTVAIVCKQRLAFKAISRSVSASSSAASTIEDALAAEIVLKEKLEDKRELVAEQAYVVGQSFWHVRWDSEGGRTVQQDMAKPIKSGYVKISTSLPDYVFYDWNAGAWDELSWVIVAERMNRWDLIAQHPELEKEIMNLPKFQRSTKSETLYYQNGKDNEELVQVYHYYHKPTPAVPFGRMTILGAEDCVFYDGQNVYECLPVIPVMPERMPDYLIGYPQFSNLAPVQEMLDHNFSVVASNQSAFGVQTVLNPRGSNMDITQIQGMQWVDYTPQTIDGGGKPEALQLTKTAPELIDMLQVYKNNMSELANINGALRGTPPAGVTAGNAIATLTANSIEFLTSFSSSVHKSVEEVVSLAIKYFYMFGAEEQLVTYADGNTSYVKDFKNSDLASFEAVRLDVVNPTMNTYAGRQNDAELLLSHNLITDVGTYYRVKEGSPVKTLYADVLDEANLIQKENDDLRQGIECPVLFVDNHQMHTQRHKAELFNPELRRNGQSVEIILKHIQEHEQFLMQQMQPQPQPQQGQPEQQLQQGQQSAQPQQPSQSAPAEPAKPKVSF